MKECLWTAASGFEDIKYEKTMLTRDGAKGELLGGVAKITINRPRVRNAFRPRTVTEMSHAFTDARATTPTSALSF